jgi:hypothetical protein
MHDDGEDVIPLVDAKEHGAQERAAVQIERTHGFP